MSFTTSCLIRKNTPEIRKKLEQLGYHAFIKETIKDSHEYLFCDNDTEHYFTDNNIEDSDFEN